MKKIHIPAIMALALAMGVTSCSEHGATDRYRANQVGVAQETATGTIIAMQDIVIDADDAKMGTAIGAAAGGLTGAMFGGGNAKYATAAGGAILGSIAGNQIDKATSSRDGLRITVKLDESNKKPITVVQQKDKKNPLWVGQKVQVLMGGNSSRVIAL